MPQTAALERAPAQQQARELPLQSRLLPLSTINAEARTAELVWTTGARVRRFDWIEWRYYWEELSLDPAHIRMVRFDNGMPLLNSHQQWDLRSVIGVVERGWMESTEGRAQVRFSDRNDEVNGIWRDVQSGIIRNVSVGYIVHRYEKIDPPELGGMPTWRAIDWEPAEISLVPVPADPLSGTRAIARDDPQAEQLLAQALAAVGHRVFPCELLAREQSSPNPAAAAADHQRQQESSMGEEVQNGGAATPPANTTTTPPAQRSEAEIRAAEQERITTIRSAVATANRTTQGLALDEAFTNGLVSRNLTVDQARAEIFARLEQHSSQNAPTRSAAGVETVRDEQVQRRSDMGAALLHRALPGRHQLPETARRYRGYSLYELARRSLEDQGLSTEGMSRMEMVSIAMGNSDAMGFRSLHGTSDFAVALASTVNRTLRDAYTSAPRTFPVWARRGTLPDFRAATRVAVAGNLTLEKVNEFGEFKRGKLVDAGETIQLATYGKVIGVTRQTVINDDLDFLSRLPAMYGRAAADFESDTVYGVLNANANMADGVALFHATHGNLGTAGAPSETTLSEARKAMRLQKDPSGNNQPLNLTARYLIHPVALETAVQKLLNAVIVATKSADTNVFNGYYTAVPEPRLDASSATAWYLASDQIDTIEYAYLDGEEGLYTEQRMGFEVDGLELKARLDFAAKATEYRGLFKNAG